MYSINSPRPCSHLSESSKVGLNYATGTRFGFSLMPELVSNHPIVKIIQLGLHLRNWKLVLLSLQLTLSKVLLSSPLTQTEKEIVACSKNISFCILFLGSKTIIEIFASSLRNLVEFYCFLGKQKSFRLLLLFFWFFVEKSFNLDECFSHVEPGRSPLGVGWNQKKDGRDRLDKRRWRQKRSDSTTIEVVDDEWIDVDRNINVTFFKTIRELGWEVFFLLFLLPPLVT